MPLPRRGAAADALARRVRRSIDYLVKVASDERLSHSGRLNSISDLQIVANVFEELSACVTGQEIAPVFMWNDIRASTAMTYFAAAAARWAATGGGMVAQECDATGVSGGSSSCYSVSVLASYSKLLSFLLECWETAGHLQDKLECIAMKVVCTALDMDLIPALSRLLASPACAPAAGTAAVRARAAALSVIHELCGLAFHNPTALLLGSADSPVCPCYAPAQQPRGASTYALKPVAACFLSVAASSAIYEHALRTVQLEAGGRGPAAAGGGHQGGLAAGALQLHSPAARLVVLLGWVLAKLKSELANGDAEEEGKAGQGKEGEGEAGAAGHGDATGATAAELQARSLRRSVRQILSGTCLQYFLAAHVACQLHAADGAGMYGLPEGAQLLPLLGCSAECECTGQVRSGGLLGALRCWEQAYAMGSGSGPTEGILEWRSVHALCMRLAVVALASYCRDLAEPGSGATCGASQGRSDVDTWEGDREEGGGAAVPAHGEGVEGKLVKQPWERLRLRASFTKPIDLCLESLLVAAAALPTTPVRCGTDTRHWDIDEEEGELERGGAEVLEGQGRAGAAGRRLVRRWWAVAVPAAHAAMDNGVRTDPDCVDVSVMRRLLDLPRLPALELDLPGEPPDALAPALAAGYLPCLERVFRMGVRNTAARERPVALLSTVASWRRTARLLAYGDVRQAAGLVATVGKVMRGLTLPLPLHQDEERAAELDEQGRPRPLRVPLVVMYDMLAWMGRRVGRLALGAAGDGAGTVGGSARPAEAGDAAGPPAASAPTQQLLLLASFAVARWLPHVAAFSRMCEPAVDESAACARADALAWVPPLVHAYAGAVDAGDAAAAAAWRALLLYDMDVLAVLRCHVEMLSAELYGQAGQAVGHVCGEEYGGRQEQGGRLGPCPRGAGGTQQRPDGVQAVLRGNVRGGGEDGAVEEFRTDCLNCCGVLSEGLWALHCVAAALPRDVSKYLGTRDGQQLVRYVRGLVRPQGIAPRPRLLQLLEKLGERAISGGGGGSGGSSKVSGAGPGGLTATIPDPAVCGTAWSSEVAAQLVAPHSVCAALGVRLCGNPRCEALSGGSELAVPLGGACTRCRAVWYCGRGCQAAHWRAGGHREVCAAAGAAAGAAEGAGGGVG